MNTDQPVLGSNTREEILSQPRCWRECIQALDETGQLTKVHARFPGPAEWLFIGCGSSYYVALAAAATWTEITGSPARAVPASDLILFPDLVLASSHPCQPVLISRSGSTSETLRAAQYLEAKINIRTLAISCAAHQPLEEVSSATLHVLPADEQSTVMTRSFSSMLLELQALAAEYGQDTKFAQSLRSLPDQAQAVLDSLPQRLENFLQARTFADYVFLGQGPFFGIASECMLKVKEMSCSYGQCFHTLEFRHGPKAIVSPETLVTFLISETGFEAEKQVLRDVKDLGGTTLVIANRADAAIRHTADFLVELNLDLAEYARLAAYVFTGQLLGYITGLKKGYDPDRPRNLNRVVLLNEKG
jgi:glucosamine--fructose-6-phosphate aminotransferase (isomerizing)